MATNPPRANPRLKSIGLGGLIGILLITALAFYQFNDKQSEIEKQINVEVSFPPVGKSDGVYQYHVWLEGAEETTMLHRVEVNLDRVRRFPIRYLSVRLEKVGNHIQLQEKKAA